MKIKALTFLGIFLIIFWAQSKPYAWSSESIDSISNVYYQVLYGWCPIMPGDSVVILKRAITQTLTDCQKDELKNLIKKQDFDLSLLRRFENLSIKESYINPEDLPPKVTILDVDYVHEEKLSHDLDRIWEKYKDKYPQPTYFVRLSQVAFNSSYSQAIVSIGFYRDPWAGGGAVLLLKKSNSKWNIVEGSIIFLT